MGRSARSVIAGRRTISGIDKDMLLDIRCETEHAHKLSDPGAGEALAPGDFSLTGNLAGVDENLPFLGFLEKLDHPRHPGHLRAVCGCGSLEGEH